MRRRRRRGHGILVWLVIGVFKLTYIVGYTMIGFLIELLRPQCQTQSQCQPSRVNTSAQQNQDKEIEQIANQDVIDALDQEIEVLRNFREDLLIQAQKTNVSATQAAKLQKQAAAVYTRMMKLNEQALKRRNK